jgi:hypothetical protein
MAQPMQEYPGQRSSDRQGSSDTDRHWTSGKDERTRREDTDRTEPVGSWRRRKDGWRGEIPGKTGIKPNRGPGFFDEDGDDYGDDDGENWNDPPGHGEDPGHSQRL